MARYSPVYSAQFINYTDTAPNQSFTVPAGFTAVVRQITIICELGGMVATVSFKNSSVAPANLFYYVSLAAVFSYAQQQLHVVVPENGEILLGLTALDLATACYVGGYLLTNTAP